MDDSILGDSLKQVGSLAKQTVKQIVKIPKEAVETATSQAGFEKKSSQKGPGEAQMQKVDRNKDTEDFVKGLYGVDNSQAQNPQDSQTAQKAVAQATGQNSKQSPEEQAKLESLRKKLHNETYYQPLITRQKTQEEVEKPKERVERLEMQDLQKKDEEKKKKAQQDVSLEREKTKTEAHRGVSG